MNQININTISRQNLIQLKGLGPSLSDRIIAARSLSSENDVLAIKGIGIASLSSIKSNNDIDFVYGMIAGFGPQFTSFLSGDLVMRSDSAGDGHWGAGRGDRDHLGLDIKCTAGESIFSPIQGEISKFGWASTSKPKLRYIEVTGSGADSRYRVRLMYSTLLDALKEKDIVGRGEEIGVAQAVSVEYRSPNMLDHIHFELFLDRNNTKVDPTPFVLG